MCCRITEKIHLLCSFSFPWHPLQDQPQLRAHQSASADSKTWATTLTAAESTPVCFCWSTDIGYNTDCSWEHTSLLLLTHNHKTDCSWEHTGLLPLTNSRGQCFGSTLVKMQIRVKIQGFDDQHLKKNVRWKFVIFIFLSKSFLTPSSRSAFPDCPSLQSRGSSTVYQQHPNPFAYKVVILLSKFSRGASSLTYLKWHFLTQNSQVALLHLKYSSSTSSLKILKRLFFTRILKWSFLTQNYQARLLQ